MEVTISAIGKDHRDLVALHRASFVSPKRVADILNGKLDAYKSCLEKVLEQVALAKGGDVPEIVKTGGDRPLKFVSFLRLVSSFRSFRSLIWVRAVVWNGGLRAERGGRSGGRQRGGQLP